MNVSGDCNKWLLTERTLTRRRVVSHSHFEELNAFHICNSTDVADVPRNCKFFSVVFPPLVVLSGCIVDTELFSSFFS